MKCFRFVAKGGAFLDYFSRYALCTAIKSVHSVSVDLNAHRVFNHIDSHVSSQVAEQMSVVAHRVPANGCTSCQMQAILAESIPNFAPSMVGALTTRQVIDKFPSLFHIEDKPNGKWIVKPVIKTEYAYGAVSSNSGLSSSPLSSSPDHANASLCALDAITRYCRSLAQERLREGQKLQEVALEDVMRATSSGAYTPRVVRYVMEHATRVGLDVKACLRIKPKRMWRSAVIFVDGDGLDRPILDALCCQLSIRPNGATPLTTQAKKSDANKSSDIGSEDASRNMETSTSVHVVRRACSPAIGNDDCITSEAVPTYLGVERKAHELRLRKPDIRIDIVYMCSDEKFDLYSKHVALSNAFPDADVYVCTPLRISLVQPKTIIQFVSD